MVILEFCVLSVFYKLSAYNSLFVLLIIWKISKNYSSWTYCGRIFDFQHCFFVDWQKVSQKWTAFVFGSKYLHQNVTKCMTNLYTNFYILTCQMWLHFMAHPLILLRFYFHTLLYLHKIFADCVTNWYPFWYAKCDFRIWMVLWFNCVFFGDFQILLLHQNFTNCMLRQKGKDNK